MYVYLELTTLLGKQRQSSPWWGRQQHTFCKKTEAYHDQPKVTSDTTELETYEGYLLREPSSYVADF